MSMFPEINVVKIAALFCGGTLFGMVAGFSVNQALHLGNPTFALVHRTIEVTPTLDEHNFHNPPQAFFWGEILNTVDFHRTVAESSGFPDDLLYGFQFYIQGSHDDYTTHPRLPQFRMVLHGADQKTGPTPEFLLDVFQHAWTAFVERSEARGVTIEPFEPPRVRYRRHFWPSSKWDFISLFRMSGIPTGLGVTIATFIAERKKIRAKVERESENL